MGTTTRIQAIDTITIPILDRTIRVKRQSIAVLHVWTMMPMRSSYSDLAPLFREPILAIKQLLRGTSIDRWRVLLAGMCLRRLIVRSGCTRLVIGVATLVWLGNSSSVHAQQPAAPPSLQTTAPLPPPEALPSAEPHDRLTLPDLEQMALVSNPSVTRLSALVGAARGYWVQVGLPPNPTAGYEGQQLGSGGLAEQHGVLFTQEIVRGGKLRLNRAVAEQQLTRADQELATQQQRVLTDVRVSFYQVLIAQRQIDLAENLVRISRQGATAVDALFRGKEANRTDVLQSQLEVENAQILS